MDAGSTMSAETDKSAATELDEALDFDPPCRNQFIDGGDCPKVARWFVTSECALCHASGSRFLCDAHKDDRTLGARLYCTACGSMTRAHVTRLERLS